MTPAESSNPHLSEPYATGIKRLETRWWDVALEGNVGHIWVGLGGRAGWGFWEGFVKDCC